MRKFVLYIAIALLLFSCKRESSFEGFWIGAAYEMDANFYTPLPRYLWAKENGEIEMGWVGSETSDTGEWRLEHQNLYIDTLKFLPAQYLLKETEFQFRDAYSSFYFNVNSAKKINAPSDYFLNKTFTSEYDTIQFTSDHEVLIQSKNRVEKACWKIWKKNGISFLLKYGSVFKCEKNPRFTEVITEINEGGFKVNRWQNGKWKSVHYTLDSKQENMQLDDFQTCNSYLYRNNPHHRYYYKDTFYKGGIYKINKLFRTQYKAPEASTESGLIKIEFIVNCKGKPGRFKMMEFDENYRLKTFPKDISKQIFEFTKTLTDWNAGVNKQREPIDTYRFLTYKIKNGKVVEIFP